MESASDRGIIALVVRLHKLISFHQKSPPYLISKDGEFYMNHSSEFSHEYSDSQSNQMSTRCVKIFRRNIFTVLDTIENRF